MPDWANYLAQALMESMKARDPYTFGHCRRVAHNAKQLAKAAGLDETQQTIIEYSSMFHDLGKIAIPDRILLKPGRLTPKEEAIMRLHPEKSIEILKPLNKVAFFKAVIPGVKHHHERMDGLGYPDRIPGDKIPLTARVILIADTFDAMTTDRPYRKGLPIDVAYAELRKFAGRQFDTQLVKIFLESHKLWQEYEEEITQEFVASHFKRVA
ncbi:MAG: HD-GYP domain-containing protein [Xanthomonadaceae bacterium]|nr:HD-GYP domain-containing protein [Xanthomonadaceae bacterium]